MTSKCCSIKKGGGRPQNSSEFEGRVGGMTIQNFRVHGEVDIQNSGKGRGRTRIKET